MKNKLLFLARYFGILTVSLGISVISTLILRFISQEQALEYIICFIVSLTVMVIGLGVLSAKDGYKTAQGFSSNDLKTYIFIFVCQFIIAIIFKFAVYISGPTYWVAHFIWLSCGHDVSGVGSAPIWLYMLCAIACDAIYILPVFIGKRQGYLYRLKKRDELKRQK